MNLSAKTFLAFDDALSWAKTYAREHTHAFQAWRIERAPWSREYAIAIYSRNTGSHQGYIHA